ncbi:MAG: hypothetical protein HZB51_19735 [Chloroflexi bacterium]|nr:hypothetical protein [Chloroflexota bacterium]
MPKRRKPQPKQAQAKPGRLDKLLSDVRAQLPGNAKVIRRPQGESKISAVFWQFLEPFKKYATTDPAMEKLVVLGVCARNACVVPPTERDKLIEAVKRAVLGQAGEEWRGELEQTLNTLIKRKERHFANDHRYIVSYQLDSTRDTYHLSMVSTLLGGTVGQDVKEESKDES